MQGAWTSSDAWIFAAIAGGADSSIRESTLSDVIGSTEVINHAVPTEDEFVQAIARLTAVGVVGVNEDGSHYWSTAAGLQLRRRWRHGLFSWDVILPGLRKLGSPPDTHWSLPEGAFARALEEAQERFEKILRRSTSSRRRPRHETVPEVDGGSAAAAADEGVAQQPLRPPEAKR